MKSSERIYNGVLCKAAKLRRTTIETGLNPCIEWNVDSAMEANKVLQGLLTAKHNNKREFGRIMTAQRSNDYSKKYVIYIWNEGKI